MSQDPSNPDPIAFFQKLWSNAGIAFPPMSPAMEGDALTRKIAELKAVQGWLQTNLGMLQASIQMLEAQQAMQAGAGAPQAAVEAWLKTLQQYQNNFKAGAQDEP